MTGRRRTGKEKTMNHHDEEILADEWTMEVAEDTRDEESSSLTWDDEVVRETHRKIAFRALRATARDLFEAA
jgi:hypothetical protein